jgi:ribonuclease BN (tRNA processing enzyme)
VLALDSPGMLADAFTLEEFTPGDCFGLRPIQCETRLLPHWMPNAGLRLVAGSRVVAYTGDTGPSPDIASLARDADLLVADATFAGHVPEDSAPYLSSARIAGRNAAAASVASLLLTHLWPGTDPAVAKAAANDEYGGEIDVARAGVVVELQP